MITRTVLMTLVFAVVIGCGAAAFALMNGGGSSMTYASSFYRDGGGEDHDDHDDHDD
ncbi:MAG: hypothetical protein HQ513_15270 [Rhodospirillales bacterium]|nr:hypothetical protein [Rhodospirillales bacterium]